MKGAAKKKKRIYKTKTLPKRKKHFSYLWLLLPLLILALYIGNKYSYLFIKLPTVHYAALNVKLPNGYSIYGIDVSHHQKRINWELVADEDVDGVTIDFAFIKATQGVNFKDPLFQYNWKKAKENNIITGAYHFFSSGKSGKLQADNFIKTVKLSKGDLPPVIDVEEIPQSASSLMKEVKIFADALEKHYKAKPIIYTYAFFYQRYFSDIFDSYPLWVAHYREEHGTPRVDREWQFWQISETATISGIDRRVDFNIFNGNREALDALRIR